MLTSKKAGKSSMTSDLDISTSGTASTGGQDSEEDEMPDYLRLASLTKSKTYQGTVKLPKRGEKDFEPTGFGGQSKLLERSRDAMISAIEGERRTMNKSLTKASWDPSIDRAVVHQLAGKLFETTGQIAKRHDGSKMISRNELLPEEALFMLERGSLELWAEGGEVMSLQQAFAMLVNRDGLTREKYQVYVYLKRLGYVVQRAEIVDAIREKPPSQKRKRANFRTEGIVADPNRPLRLVSILDLLLYIPRRIMQLGADEMWVLARRWFSLLVQRIRSITARISGTTLKGSPTLTNGTSRGLLGYQTWTSYNAIFHSLQIVPSGHDFHLPRPSSATPTRTITNPTPTLAPASYTTLEPFYYAWRPATCYRKTHPPAPEFRIAIIDAQTHPLPSLWQFEHMFNAIPLPGSSAELLGTSAGQDDVQRLKYELELKKKTEMKNKEAYGKFSQSKQKFLAEKRKVRNEEKERRKTLWMKLCASWGVVRVLNVIRVLAKLFRHAPPGCFVPRGQQKRQIMMTASPPNPFPPLKAGRRTIVLAVVDSGITTLLRFGETEFAKWRLHGLDGPGRST